MYKLRWIIQLCFHFLGQVWQTLGTVWNLFDSLTAGVLTDLIIVTDGNDVHDYGNNSYNKLELDLNAMTSQQKWRLILLQCPGWFSKYIWISLWIKTLDHGLFQFIASVAVRCPNKAYVKFDIWTQCRRKVGAGNKRRRRETDSETSTVSLLFDHLKEQWFKKWGKRICVRGKSREEGKQSEEEKEKRTW